MKEWYKISGPELLELIHDSLKLMALENGGVDNWEWYGAAINDFLNDNGEKEQMTLYDLAMIELNNYDEAY